MGVMSPRLSKVAAAAKKSKLFFRAATFDKRGDRCWRGEWVVGSLVVGSAAARERRERYAIGDWRYSGGRGENKILVARARVQRAVFERGCFLQHSPAELIDYAYYRTFFKGDRTLAGPHQFRLRLILRTLRGPEPGGGRGPRSVSSTKYGAAKPKRSGGFSSPASVRFSRCLVMR